MSHVCSDRCSLSSPFLLVSLCHVSGVLFLLVVLHVGFQVSMVSVAGSDCCLESRLLEDSANSYNGCHTLSFGWAPSRPSCLLYDVSSRQHVVIFVGCKPETFLLFLVDSGH